MTQETLRVRVRARWLPDKSAKEGDEVDIPTNEARKLEKRGYVEIIAGNVGKDMGTEGTITGLPKEEKKAAPPTKEVAKKSPPPKSKPKTAKR